MVALTSLCAEGTPVLVLEMCRRWVQRGILPHVVTLSAEPRDLAAEFERLGVEVETLALPDSGFNRYGKMAAEFSRVSRRIRPAAFLCMPLGWHAFMGAGARWAGVPRVVAHVGNYPPHWTGSAFDKFRFLIQLGRGVTDKLVCCSDYVQRGVEEHFRVPEDELAMLYNGCPVEEVWRRASAVRATRTAGHARIGMVARLEVHKDQPTLIRAAASLARRGLSFEVLLVGEGSRRAEYAALIQELGLGDVVRLAGMRRDVPELLGTLDAFIFAAKPDEGLGVALVEAMAAKLPIIATDVGACREVLDGGALGTLIPPKDPEQLARAIESVLTDRRAAESRAACAQDKAFSTFTIERMADAYARCLQLPS